MLDKIGNYEILHTYKEGNMVADFLENYGCDQADNEVTHVAALGKMHYLLETLLSKEERLC